jgi:hypothetical protein
MICNCGRVDFDSHDQDADTRSVDASTASMDASQQESGIQNEVDGSTSTVDAFPPNQFLEDSFNTPGVDSIWQQWSDPGTTIAETNNQLTITLAADQSGSSYAGYTTVGSHDMQDGYFEIEGVQMPTADNWGEMFFTITDGSYIALFGYSYGRMVARTETVAHTDRSTTLPSYDPIAARFWRMRSEGTEMVWETSPDGTSWNERRRDINPVNMSAVSLKLYGGTFNSQPNPGVAIYDNFTSSIVVAIP